jgi:acyl-coenzyme A synthetase/AMP-(fatty) acid ligase/acyl carrier protein
LSVLKQVIASGEALTPLQVELFNKLLAKSSGTNLANLYGPTEATIDVSYFDCSPGESFERIPIGKPIDNIQLHILDKRLQALQPVGVAGELCISGVGLASGYINRPELTSEKFIKQVTGAGDRCRWETIYNKKLLRGVPGRRRQKIYRTGDLARWLPDGNIDFLGRLDHQVKIRGFRIELAEIERQLLNHKEIKEAVVLLKESAGISSVSNTNGKKYLSAYIVAQKEFNAVSLREYLSKELPDYMVPSSFIQVEQIPLTLSGKVDRKALESYGTELQTGVEFVAPRNDIEIRIANLWEEVLQVDKVGIDENFFDLGGTSMDMIKLNVKLNEIFNVDGALMKMFRFPTIRSFARYLNPGRKAIGPQANQIDPPVSVDRIKNRRANRKNKRRGYNYV